VPLSVLHVSETTDGGVGRVLSQLVSAQTAAGWRVGLAAPCGAGLDDACRASGGLVRAWAPGARPGLGLPASLRELADVVRAADPDLVHLHSSMAGLCGRLVVRGRRPTLFQPHSWSFWARGGGAAGAARVWERAAAQWADAVLCVGEDERRAAAGLGLRTRLVMVPNGVDLERCVPGDRAVARDGLGLDGSPLAVCVGRLHRQKGQHLLLDAWPAVLARVPDARLVLVGAGPDEAALRARRPERTRFVGATSDVRSWLVAADVVVQPSAWEGMPLSVLEAMGCARSVVGTDVVGLRGLVDGAGVLVPREAAALADAIAARLLDRRSADEEGARGRARVEAHHDERRRVAEVLALATELVDGRR
jgi:glycosyltransferase involved in cell wall biosynthesis